MIEGMLAIRSAQMEVLGDAVRLRFRNQVAAEIREHLPDHYAALGESGVHAAIEAGISQARGYAIVTEAGVTIFVRFMMLFGLEFDEDPSLPWARLVLEDPGYADEASRIAALRDAGMEYLRALESGQSHE
jgi:hypothetical protein